MVHWAWLLVTGLISSLLTFISMGIFMFKVNSPSPHVTNEPDGGDRITAANNARISRLMNEELDL